MRFYISSYIFNVFIGNGISILLLGYYLSNYYLFGHILQGNTDNNIIQKINELELLNPINNHSIIFNFKNDIQNLINLFFDLKNKKTCLIE